MEQRKTLAAPGYHPYHTTLNLVLAEFLGAGIIAQWKHACGLGLRMKIWPIISERRRKEDWQARSPSTVFYKPPLKEKRVGDCGFILCHLIKGRWPSNTNNKKRFKGEIFLSEKYFMRVVGLQKKRFGKFQYPVQKAHLLGTRWVGYRKKIFMLYRTIKRMN